MPRTRKDKWRAYVRLVLDTTLVTGALPCLVLVCIFILIHHSVGSAVTVVAALSSVCLLLLILGALVIFVLGPLFKTRRIKQSGNITHHAPCNTTHTTSAQNPTNIH